MQWRKVRFKLSTIMITVMLLALALAIIMQVRQSGLFSPPREVW